MFWLMDLPVVNKETPLPARVDRMKQDFLKDWKESMRVNAEFAAIEKSPDVGPRMNQPDDLWPTGAPAND